MAYQGINTGTGANTDTGDTLLSGAEKINSNFIELYAAVGIGSTSSHVVTDIFAGDNIGVNTTTGEVTVSLVGVPTSIVGGEDITVTASDLEVPTSIANFLLATPKALMAWVVSELSKSRKVPPIVDTPRTFSVFVLTLAVPNPLIRALTDSRVCKDLLLVVIPV